MCTARSQFLRKCCQEPSKDSQKIEPCCVFVGLRQCCCSPKVHWENCRHTVFACCPSSRIWEMFQKVSSGLHVTLVPNLSSACASSCSGDLGRHSCSAASYKSTVLRQPRRCIALNIMDLSRSVAMCGLDASRRDAIQSFLAFVSKASTKHCIKSFLLCPTLDSASFVPVVELLQGALALRPTLVAFPVSSANQRCITSALISVFKFASIVSSSLRSIRSTTPSSLRCFPSVR
mmetsp:Transcript_1161/g.7538  ORF Transcript_1161/g.7538 Transcript_1161/m.7538 type:complete len:233 (+) Transcript_1161:262-960(+)